MCSRRTAGPAIGPASSARSRRTSIRP
jgi:hypothetical protein